MPSLVAKPLPMEEAIRFFARRLPILPEEFEALEEAARARAFTLAGVACLDLLFDVWQALDRAIEEGTTLQEFRKSLREIAQRRGWDGVTPWRADTIFRTNIQTAYAVGRYQQMTHPDVVAARPYWMYDAVMDDRTRPTHAALHGTVRRYDDPFWQVYYPPNGYRCRCSVRSLSPADVERLGLEVGAGMPEWVQRPDGLHQPLLPDPGFAGNPATSQWEPDLDKYPPVLREAFLERQRRAGIRRAQ